MTRARRGRLWTGTSGYVYRDWRGRFYPRALAARAWLPYYATHVDTLELNTSFYRLPAGATFRAWRDTVPDDFVFSVKASRYLTHLKRLKDPAAPLRLFLGRARQLRGKLGPVLFQLPGMFHADAERLDMVLRVLGRQRHVKDLRAVLEVRYASWLEPAIVDRLRAAGVALCFHDWRDLPVGGPVTADFVYVRRHGTSRRYRGSYPAACSGPTPAPFVAGSRTGSTSTSTPNNDYHGHAVRNALGLRALLGDA